MSEVETLIRRAGVHDDWRPLLIDALDTLEPDYLQSLIDDHSWLPGIDQLLAAFRRDRGGVRYLLIGESPYPRRESANGIAFYDAAVGSLWSEQGLSKAVNRATSLRNIVKAALLEAFDEVGGADYLVGVARSDPRTFCMLLAKLLPAELKLAGGDDGVPLVVIRDYTGGKRGA